MRPYLLPIQSRRRRSLPRHPTVTLVRSASPSPREVQVRKFTIPALLLLFAGAIFAQEVVETNRVLPSKPVTVNSSNLSSNDLASAFDSPIRPRITRGSSQYIVSPTWSSEGATRCFKG